MVSIQDESQSFDITVSYLHDSLRNLAEAAKELRDGADAARVIFMDEPGEIQLILAQGKDTLHYELRWFDDWNSWGMHPDDNFKVVHQGTTTIQQFSGEVNKELKAILKQYGEDGYKERWIEHEFPIDLMRVLQQVR